MTGRAGPSRADPAVTLALRGLSLTVPSQPFHALCARHFTRWAKMRGLTLLEGEAESLGELLAASLEVEGFPLDGIESGEVLLFASSDAEAVVDAALCAVEISDLI